MADSITIPIKMFGSDRWGQLSVFSDSHLICGETVRMKEADFSFVGGHRVRLYSFKKNVHWKIPEGVSLDISAVTPATAPPRKVQR
jgi:hypothetical protein